MKDGEYPQFNMPYELGLDIGCKEYGGKKYAAKKCLILERNEYQYLRVLSDIRGQDINHHNDDPEKLIEAVRNRFAKISIPGPPAANFIWNEYNEFYNDFINDLKNKGWTAAHIKNMPFSEYISIARVWIRDSA